MKIKYSDFTQATRSRTGTIPLANMAEILDTAADLLTTVYPFKRPVRLLGVTLSSLTTAGIGDAQRQSQLDLGL